MVCNPVELASDWRELMQGMDHEELAIRAVDDRSSDGRSRPDALSSFSLRFFIRSRSDAGGWRWFNGRGGVMARWRWFDGRDEVLLWL